MELIKTENNNRHEKIEGIRLFRNDVEKIIETYTAEGYSLSIYDDTYKYDNLNEYIENHGYIIKKLNLLFRKTEEDLIGFNTFILEGNTVTIITDNRIDLFTEIFEYLKKRKPYVNYLLWQNSPIVPFSVYLFFVTMTAMPIFKNKNLILAENINNPKTQLLTLSFILISGYLLLSFLFQKYYLRISLEKAHKTGIKKYRSEIIVGVVVAILTFLLTKLGEWAF